MIKLLSLNVEGDNHLQDVQRLLQSEQPDVACLQEVFHADVGIFEKAAGLVATYVPMTYFDELSETPRMPARGSLGLATLTRRKVSSAADFYVGSPHRIPRYRGRNAKDFNRILLRTGITTGGKEIIFLNTHFTWSPEATESPYQRRDIRRLIRLLPDMSEFVLCGDLNAPRGGAIYSQLAEQLHDRIPTEIKTTVDHMLHQRGAVIPPIVVDMLFTTSGVTAGSPRLLDGVSDHWAIIALIS